MLWSTTTATRRGQLAGLIAAVLFGCSAPLVSTLTGSGSALSIAGLLYAGATLALLAVRLVRGTRAETPIRREDWPALGALTLLGGVVAPVALVLGLARLPAATSSLLLNLEAVFTLAIAVLLGREHLGRRGLVAALLTIVGAVVLSQGSLSGANALGGALIALATLAWGIDNNLSQRLSLRDPLQIATAKAAGASLSVRDGDPGAAGHRRPGLRHFNLARSGLSGGERRPRREDVADVESLRLGAKGQIRGCQGSLRFIVLSCWKG
jgi:drug/metabolite transporter (DMT)-like permease